MASELVSEARLADKASELAQNFSNGVIHLHGDLGAGKTTFCQHFIRTHLPEVCVTSPTYTLVQEYRSDACCLYHIDLYRLHHPQEAQELALAEMVTDHSVLLIEWPHKGGMFVPPADVTVRLDHADLQYRHLAIHHDCVT